ncbi:MAG: ribonuclease HII [Candidatus Bathyarchaeia archaeon]
MGKLIAGVDDAGRGPVVGPLVIAGVLIDEDRVNELIKIGVKDSKKLSPNSRKILFDQIRRGVNDYFFVEISPSQIDEVVEKGRKLYKLNFLEAKAMAEVISILKPDIAYVDSSDVDPDRFAEQIADGLPFEVKIISEHHADEKYPVVSAASILAKVKRDEIIDRIKAEYGDFGSGYPQDPKTLKFLREWMKEHKEFPSFVRKSWKTAKRVEKRVASL